MKNILKDNKSLENSEAFEFLTNKFLDVMIGVDIYECDLDTHGCSENATCTNTCNSYTCECKDGYTGYGLRREGGVRGKKKNKFGLYQSPTCHGVTTFYGIAKSSFMTKIWCIKVWGITHFHTKNRRVK